MTDTMFTGPRLERPAEAPLGGVCLALARTTGTDAVLWRVLFVVLSIFGGLGAALYLACYVAIPAEGSEHSLAMRLLHGPDRRVSTRQVLLLALVVVAVVLAVHNNGGWLVAALVAGLGYTWWRRRHPSPVPTWTEVEPSAATPPAPAPAPDDVAASAAAFGVPPPAWQPPVVTPRPRSVITPLTLSTASLAVGVLLLLAAAGSVSIPTEVVLATALGVVGLGLVVSAFWGRARGLVPIALLLAMGLVGTVGARPMIDHGVGNREWTATSSGDYRLGAGEATLTLSPSRAADGPATVTVHVSFGHLILRVPKGVHAVIDARVTNGDLTADGVDANGRRVHRVLELGTAGQPEVHVDARVAVGQLEVRRG